MILLSLSDRDLQLTIAQNTGMAWLVLRSRAKFYQHGGYYVSKAEVGVAAMGLLLYSLVKSEKNLGATFPWQFIDDNEFLVYLILLTITILPLIHNI